MSLVKIKRYFASIDEKSRPTTAHLRDYLQEFQLKKYDKQTSKPRVSECHLPLKINRLFDNVYFREIEEIEK